MEDPQQLRKHTHAHALSGFIFSMFWPPRHQITCALPFGLSGHFLADPPPHQPALLSSLAPSPEAKRGKIRLQSSSKILLTSTHFLMFREGGRQRGSLDWSPDSGMSQPFFLCAAEQRAAAMGCLSSGAITDEADNNLKGARWGRIYKGLSVGRAGFGSNEEMGARLRGCY